MHNVGKTGRIFDEKHPYFSALDCTDDKPTAGLKKKCKQVRRNLMERAKIKFPLYRTYKKTKNGYLKVSAWAKKAPDYERNLALGYKLAVNFKVKITPYINIPHYKNPEFYLDNFNMFFDAVIERKTKDVRNYIKNAFNDKFRKGGQLYRFKKAGLILKVDSNELKDVFIKLNGEFKFHKKAYYVILQVDDEFIVVHRDDDLKQLFYKIKKQNK